MRLCLLGEKSQRECHLDRYNKYGFVITMTHADPNYPSFELKAKHAESKDRRFSKVQIKVVVGNRLRVSSNSKIFVEYAIQFVFCFQSFVGH